MIVFLCVFFADFFFQNYFSFFSANNTKVSNSRVPVTPKILLFLIWVKNCLQSLSTDKFEPYILFIRHIFVSATFKLKLG